MAVNLGQGPNGMLRFQVVKDVLLLELFFINVQSTSREEAKKAVYSRTDENTTCQYALLQNRLKI